MDKKERDPCEVELEKVLQLCAEKNVDPEVKDAVARARKLVLDRDRYCEDISSQHSAPLTKIIDDTFSHPFDEAFETGKTKWRLTPRMCSGTLVGNFLQSIVSISKAKRVLEIGTFTGYMALACAEVLPADGVVVTCEFDPYLVELAGQFFQGSPHKDKIQIRQGDAKDTLSDLAKEGLQFDIVFIDANKRWVSELLQEHTVHEVIICDHHEHIVYKVTIVLTLRPLSCTLCLRAQHNSGVTSN